MVTRLLGVKIKIKKKETFSPRLILFEMMQTMKPRVRFKKQKNYLNFYSQLTSTKKITF